MENENKQEIPVRDIHEGVDLEASLVYRERCIAEYWNAQDRLACANIAITAINHHIKLLKNAA